MWQRATHFRPLVFSAVALGAGIAAQAYAALPIEITGLFVCVLALAAALLRTRRRICLALALCACFFAGMARAHLSNAALPVSAPAEGGFSARVDDIPQYTEKGWRVSLGGRVRTLLTIGDKEHQMRIAYGDILYIQAPQEPPSPRRNPGGPDMRKTLLAKGYGYRAYADAEQITVHSGGGRDIKGAVLGIRSAIERSLFASMPPKSAGIYRAILFGDKSTLDDESYAAFRETGVAHVLAVSGLHVGGLAMMLSWLLRKLRVKPITVFLSTCAFLLLYCALAGFSPSVSRASLMVSLLLLGRAAGRQTDTLTSMAAAFIALLLVNPMQLYSLGFQLSFSAVFGLLTLSDPLVRLLEPIRRNRIGRWIASCLAATTAATLGTLPVMAMSFGELPLSSLPANLLIVPLAAPLLLFGLLTALLGLAWPGVGAILGGIAAKAMDWLLELMSLLRKWGMLSLPMIPVWFMLGIWVCCLLFSRYCLLKRRNSIASALLAALIAVFSLSLAFRPLPLLEITVLDVGQGNSVIIRASRRTLLVDAGGALDYDYGERVVWPALRSMGVTRLDAILLTHAHNDHAGGVSALLERLRTDGVIMPQTGEDDDVRLLLRSCEAKGVHVVLVSERMSLELGQGFSIDMIRGEGEGLNEKSLAFILQRETPIMLITGDMGLAQEEALLPDLVQTPLIEAGHHGSRYATGEALLQKTRPSLAVISVGRNNYGHPHPDTLARLEAIGAKVLRTDTCGAVTIRLNDEGLGYAVMLKEEENK